MSSIGSSGTSRITPPATVDGDATSTGGGTEASPSAAVVRGSAPGGRSAVGSSIGRSAATSASPVAAELGGEIVVRADGSIVAKSPAPGSTPAETLNQLALGIKPGSANVFASVTDKALLQKIADRLAETHRGLTGKAPDDGTTLAWRQTRGATLALMEQAAIQAKKLGDANLCKTLTGKLVEEIKREPWRQVRDFAYESLVARAETKDLPAVRAAKEAIYPSKPPYEKWLKDGKIDIFFTFDNDGSKIEDQLEYFRESGFRVTKQPDDSYVAKRPARDGKPAIHVTIPALPKDGSPPPLFDEMDNPQYDIIAYGGHAGYGQRVEHALSKGVKGTGEDKLILLMQCWGHGNVETLERNFPDAQLISTTEMTSDDMDWMLYDRLFEGFDRKAGWNEIQKKIQGDLKREYEGDSSVSWENHYLFPTTRTALAVKYDRDGDGISDAQDHVFNVIYPKRVDAAGGYDPVVQGVPKYALDGTSLNQALNQVSLVVRYDHLLPPSLESKLVWNADKWKSGGFFEPEAGDNSAFRFTKNAAGEVEVTLSTRFAHTGKQELSRMMAYEAGLWLADEAGLAGAEKTMLAIGMTQRVVDAQGSWASSSGQLLDEPWAEEELFGKRYGLSGFTFAELSQIVGDAHDFHPEQYRAITERLRTIPGLAALAEREPTRVGVEIPVVADIRFLSDSGWTSVTQQKMADAMRKLGVEGEVKSFSPSWLNQNQATNVTAVVQKDGKTQIISLGIDSEGVLRAAARLDMDVSKKAAMTVREVLASGFSSTPAVVAEFDRQRAAGKSVLDATREAMRKAPAGASTPSLWSIDGLEQAGFLSSTDVSDLKHAIRRGNP